MIRAFYGWYLCNIKGEYELAYQLVKKELELDPENISIKHEYAWHCYASGRKKKAFEVYQEMRDEHPESIYGYSAAMFYLFDGNDEIALKYARKYAEIAMENGIDEAPWDFYFQGLIHARDRNREKALEFIETLEGYRIERLKAMWDYSFPKAVTYAMLNDKDKAIHYLKVSIEDREDTVKMLKFWTPYFYYNIKDEPEFKEVLKEIGLEE